MSKKYTIRMCCRVCGVLLGFRLYGGAPMSEDWICTECDEPGEPS